MRKLLLATVAGMGVSIGLAGYADAQSYDTASGDDTAGQSFPTAGSVTVRLNGRIRFYADYAPQTRQANIPITGSTTGTAQTGGAPSGSGTNKLANYTFFEYARLYPGFDGVTANGLK